MAKKEQRATVEKASIGASFDIGGIATTPSKKMLKAPSAREGKPADYKGRLEAQLKEYDAGQKLFGSLKGAAKEQVVKQVEGGAEIKAKVVCVPPAALESVLVKAEVYNPRGTGSYDWDETKGYRVKVAKMDAEGKVTGYTEGWENEMTRKGFAFGAADASKRMTKVATAVATSEKKAQAVRSALNSVLARGGFIAKGAVKMDAGGNICIYPDNIKEIKAEGLSGDEAKLAKRDAGISLNWYKGKATTMARRDQTISKTEELLVKSGKMDEGAAKDWARKAKALLG